MIAWHGWRFDLSLQLHAALPHPDLVDTAKILELASCIQNDLVRAELIALSSSRKPPSQVVHSPLKQIAAAVRRRYPVMKLMRDEADGCGRFWCSDGDCDFSSNVFDGFREIDDCKNHIRNIHHEEPGSDPHLKPTELLENHSQGGQLYEILVCNPEYAARNRPGKAEIIASKTHSMAKQTGSMMAKQTHTMAKRMQSMAKHTHLIAKQTTKDVEESILQLPVQQMHTHMKIMSRTFAKV